VLYKYIYKGSLQIDYFFSGLARTKAYWLKIWKQENVSLRHLCPALWRCGHITMKFGTYVHHDVKCKLWKNKMAVTYISRLDELGNFARTKAYWLKIWKQENVSLRHLCPARHFSVKTIILPEDLEFYIMMYMCTYVHHDVKCKLWKNKMAVTYISRLDELGNFWRFASDLPLCWSYSSMKMWSYYRETWYTCTSWYKILDLRRKSCDGRVIVADEV
jgi:hypothetical protein